MSRPRAAAILLAAGRGDRMGGLDKALVPLAGLPAAAHAIRAFAACAGIDQIVLVASDTNADALRGLGAAHGGGKVTAVVPGGSRRQDSVAAGLAALSEVELVAVHDVARPLVERATIERGLALAAQHGAAVPAAPVADTIKEAAPDGRVLRTLPRDRLWAAQTPQVFSLALLRRAHAGGGGATVSDDAALVEALGAPVVLYEAPAANLKLTHPSDLLLAGALLAARAGAAAAAHD